MPSRLPEDSRRLFAHYCRTEDLAEDAPGLVMAKLMEEGDSDDLRWLTSRYTEAQIAEWLVQHGQRQLARRSLSLWRLLLNRPDLAIPETTDALWPL